MKCFIYFDTEDKVIYKYCVHEEADAGIIYYSCFDEKTGELYFQPLLICHLAEINYHLQKADLNPKYMKLN